MNLSPDKKYPIVLDNASYYFRLNVEHDQTEHDFITFIKHNRLRFLTRFHLNRCYSKLLNILIVAENIQIALLTKSHGKIGTKS